MRRKKELSRISGLDAGSVVAYVVFVVIFTAVLIGLVLYLVSLYKSQQFRPFDLATVVALLGGFLFVCATAGSCPKELRLRLMIFGVAYLISTMAFVIFGFYQAADQAELANKLSGSSKGWFVGVYDVTFYLGAIALSVALSGTVWSIPGLIRWRGRKEVSSSIDDAERKDKAVGPRPMGIGTREKEMKQPKVLAVDLLLDLSGPPQDSQLRDLVVKEKEGKIKIWDIKYHEPSHYIVVIYDWL